MDEVRSNVRTRRSYGCNGPNRKNADRCIQHCKFRNYSGGRCDKKSNYTRCRCV